VCYLTFGIKYIYFYLNYILIICKQSLLLNKSLPVLYNNIRAQPKIGSITGAETWCC